MKKVININFQGQVIAIEETAYELLKQYIESLKRYFSRETYGDEIVNDIESRIAELFGNRLKLGIPCITDEDVTSIIASIGKPEDFDMNYEEASSNAEKSFSQQANHHNQKKEKEQDRQLYRNENDKVIAGVCSGLAHNLKIDPVWVRLAFILLVYVSWIIYIVLWIVLKPKALDTNVSKRLYRNPTEKILGGVCSGIAAFFNINVWIPRVIFLLPLIITSTTPPPFFYVQFWSVPHNIGLSFGFFFIAYIVLWIITPEATTLKQKLEMLGEENDIQSIRDTVSDNVEFVKNRTAPPVPNSERSGCLNALLVFGKIILMIFLGFIVLSVVSSIVIAAIFLFPLRSLVMDDGGETILLLITFGLLLMVPLASIITWAIRRSMKAKSRPVIGVIATILWLIGILLAVVLAINIASNYRVEATYERIVPISHFESNKMVLEMQPYNNDFAPLRIGITRYPNNIHGLPYVTVNEDSLLLRSVHLRIRETADSQFRVRTIAVATGRDLRSAQANARQIAYQIVQHDSLLLLPEFVKVPRSQGLRNQSVTIEVLVPAGHSVETCDVLSRTARRWVPTAADRRMRR